MKTSLLAAALTVGTLLAAPAFAGNTASNAPFPSFDTASTGAVSRADVKAELIAAENAKPASPQGNRVDPAVASIERVSPTTNVVSPTVTADATLYQHP